MNDLIDQEFGGQNIDINNDNKEKISSETRDSKVSKSSSQNNDNNSSESGSKIVTIDKMISKSITDKAKDQVYKSWIDRYLCCFNWLKKYFQITSKDFFRRILLSIIPFNKKFYEAC